MATVTLYKDKINGVGSLHDDILLSGLSGVISGGIMGGIMGGVQFKLTVKSIEKYGLKVENGKVEGKIPIDKYLKANGWL